MEEWLSNNLWSVWLGAAAVLGAAEMFSLDLVLVMLAIGAVGGMTAALLGAPLVLQVLVAAAGSVAMLGLVRPSVARRLHQGPNLTLGHDKLVGQRGVVTQQLSGLSHGRIRIGGEDWTAEPYDDTLTIEAGETVEVLKIRGATALVHPLPSIDPPLG